jgi:peptide/nickel transport system permease protein
MTETNLTSTSLAAVPDLAPLQQPRRRRLPTSVVAAGIWLTVIAVAAAAADLLPLADPDVDVDHGVRTTPFTMWSEPLGTDGFGRSVIARIIFGARVSLATGLISVTIAFAIGLMIGVAAGYFRGKVDSAIGLLTDTALAFPGIILLLTLVSVLRPRVSTIIIGLSVLAIPAFVRLARANTLQFRSAEFVLAARGLGATRRTIVFREIIPNVATTLIAYAGIVAAALILAEAGLSFLGLGVPPPQATWGSMISEGRSQMREFPALTFVPVAFLFLTIYSLNVVGEWARARSGSSSKL